MSPHSPVTGRDGGRGNWSNGLLTGAERSCCVLPESPGDPRPHCPHTTEDFHFRGRERQRLSQTLGRGQGMEGKIAGWERGPDRSGVGGGGMTRGREKHRCGEVRQEDGLQDREGERT